MNLGYGEAVSLRQLNTIIRSCVVPAVVNLPRRGFFGVNLLTRIFFT